MNESGICAENKIHLTGEGSSGINKPPFFVGDRLIQPDFLKGKTVFDAVIRCSYQAKAFRIRSVMTFRMDGAATFMLTAPLTKFAKLVAMKIILDTDILYTICYLRFSMLY